MNKLQLFWTLRKNIKLSEKRNVMFEANQYGKFFGYIALSIFAIEFIALGTFFGWLFQYVGEMTIISPPNVRNEYMRMVQTVMQEAQTVK